MSAIVFIETAWGERDIAIELDRTEDFIAAARTLNDYLNSLDLPADEHNKFVELMIAQVQEAERGAFAQGFKMGMEYGGKT